MLSGRRRIAALSVNDLLLGCLVQDLIHSLFVLLHSLLYYSVVMGGSHGRAEHEGTVAVQRGRHERHCFCF
jgi:hypothetical protein